MVLKFSNCGEFPKFPADSPLFGVVVLIVFGVIDPKFGVIDPLFGVVLAVLEILVVFGVIGAP